MAVIYVTEQGSILSRQENRLVITRQDIVQASIPIQQVEQIVLLGNVHLTTPLVVHCLRSGVDVCYLSQSGAYHGRLQSAMSGDARLRQEQYRRCEDSSFVLQMARALVRGKIRNQAVFFRRRDRGDRSTAKQLQKLVEYGEQVGQAESLDMLRGLEGAAANLYFTLFASTLKGDVPMMGARQRPAKDPVNTLLNLGYSLLYTNMVAVLHLVGLDPYLGYLHAVRRGHAALASDLMEEFRSAAVDSVVAQMINRREISSRDFLRDRDECRLKPAALKCFLAHHQERMDTPVLYKPLGARFTYRKLLELQVRHAARVILGAESEYRSWKWDW